MNGTITGQLHELFDVQEFGTFKKRELVIKVNKDINGSAYTDYVKAQVCQKNIELFSDIRVGDEIEVSYNIRGSRYDKEGKTYYITNLDIWKCQVVGRAAAPPPKDDDDDKLPF